MTKQERTENYRAYLFECGFTEKEVEQKLAERDYLAEQNLKNKEPREITSSTYIRAQNRLKKEVEDWFGVGRRR